LQQEVERLQAHIREQDEQITPDSRRLDWVMDRFLRHLENGVICRSTRETIDEAMAAEAAKPADGKEVCDHP
jgi:uncharacterized protein YicC (UPF0701 family)